MRLSAPQSGTQPTGLTMQATATKIVEELER